MKELETYIRGHIFEIKELYDDIFKLEEYFSFTPENLERIAADLKKSVEKGVLEYKKRIITSVFTFLETLKYDFKGFDRLETFISPLTGLVYMVLTQRLLAKGALRTFDLKPEGPDAEAIKEEDLSIKEIFTDVQLRTNNNPDLKNDQRIKTILLQVRQYAGELEKKKGLEPNILPEKRKAFEENYARIFNDIVQKIRESYSEFLASEEKNDTPAPKQKKLSDYDLQPLLPIYRNQFEMYSTLRSTIIYAAKERYHIRETLADLQRRHADFLTLLEEEDKKMHLAAPFEVDVKNLIHLYTSALIHILERHASLMK